MRTAVAFEDLGVSAYKGQAPRISSPTYLAFALSIHAVEATPIPAARSWALAA